MARKTSGYSLNDSKTKAIIEKYLAGKELTTEEKKVMAGLIRQYPTIFGGGKGSLSGGGANGGRNVNVNLSSVQTNPYAARSQYNQTRTSNARRSYGGWGGGSSQVTSPGGFKSSGRDSESQARRAGNLTPDAVKDEVQFAQDGSTEVGGRKYSAREVESIVSRGQSGATMNWKDQAIYDAYVRDKKEEPELWAKAKQAGITKEEYPNLTTHDLRGLNLDEIIAEKALENAAAASERERKQKSEADLQKRERDLADWKAKDAVRRQYEVEDAAAKAKAEEQKRKDEELKWKLDKKGGGFRYTEKQKKDYDKLTQAIVDAQSGVDQEGNFLGHEDRDENGLTEQDRYIKRLQELRDQIYYNPVASLEKDQTAQDKFDQSIVTKEFDDGSVVEGYVDEHGKFSEIKRPKEDTSAEDARRKYILDRVEKDRGSFSKLDTKNEYLMNNGVPTRQKNPDYGREFDPIEAMRQAASDYDAVRDGTYNTPATPPTTAAQTDVSEVDGFPESAPTSPTNGSGWKDFFGAPEGQGRGEGEGDMPTGSQVACPVCGTPLNEDGRCDECGYGYESSQR